MIDNRGHEYPSEIGALENLMDVLEGGEEAAWYSFKKIAMLGTDEAHINAISYDEAGDPYIIYSLKIKMEGVANVR